MSTLTPEVVIHLVRKFIRDTPKLNELRRVAESDDDDIKFAINMSISDWNSTPPLMSPVGLSNFPVLDWLVISSAMWLLQSAGVLQHRNELAYSDTGINVSPWTKGPAYFNIAGMWANLCEAKKRDFKVALNYAQTFGTIKSSEYLTWDFAGLYSGPQFDNKGFSLSAQVPQVSPDPTMPGPATPSKTPPLNFKLADWTPNPLTGQYSLFYMHNLMADVDVRIVDPNSGQDLRNKLEIRFANKNMIQLFVPMNPDGRIEGQMIVFKI